jgi:hypothetical protein
VGIELLTLRVRPIFCVRVGRQDVSITLLSPKLKVDYTVAVYFKLCRESIEVLDLVDHVLNLFRWI